MMMSRESGTVALYCGATAVAALMNRNWRQKWRLTKSEKEFLVDVGDDDGSAVYAMMVMVKKVGSSIA